MRLLRRPRRAPRPNAMTPPPPAAQPPAPDGHGAQMTLLQHLAELRQRAMWAVLALVGGTLLGSLVAEPVIAFLGQPYLALREGTRFIILDPTGSVIAYFRVALLVGAVISVPVVTYQLVLFILPATTRGQRRAILAALPAVAALFCVGVAFAWYVLIPPALAFLAGFQAELFQTAWEAQRYLAFVTSLLFWMGVAFQTPLVMFVLSLLGFVRAGTLVRSWRIAIVASAIAAALITPTVDPVNMLLVMTPLLALYGVSILLTGLGARLFDRRTATPATPSASPPHA